MLSKRQRATICVALFLFSTAIAQVSYAIRSETYKDIITKAQNLILQKDRPQALLILNKAIQRESNPQAVIELKQVALDISHLFLSDKSQQLYESSVANRRIDLNQSLENVSDAVKIEPDNITILIEHVRVLIARNECKAAEELIAKNLANIEFDEDMRLAHAQTLVCQKKWLDYQKLAEKALKKKGEFYIYWLALEIQKQISNKNLLKAQEVLLSINKADEKYPEASYFSWRLSSEQHKKRVVDAQKYLMTCKNISANQYRQYMMDPSLCRQIGEVEKELKGFHGASD